jgi:hypothetical protein
LRIPRAKIFPPKHDNPARLDGGALQMKSAANVSQQLSRAKKGCKTENPTGQTSYLASQDLLTDL